MLPLIIDQNEKHAFIVVERVGHTTPPQPINVGHNSLVDRSGIPQ
jgi:hypothetical protein